ncbi:hypothetical protein Ahy_B01g056384 [Arachis hypogaea]|uniref:Aminotransferase-like plant mobile domain-containing protein n=1 Tax=Arachis hypogaea TaxID=3818 RepID=A0A445AYP0_ARAHY|nr:hypothetical protein Ahy_B01g056384 [Arachis hypogaea]
MGYDCMLVFALVNRWRSESHAFHMPCGEIIILLQDVAYQLGLLTNGEPVSSWMNSWEIFYQRRTIKDILCWDLEENLTDKRLMHRVSWGSVVLAFLYKQMCRSTNYKQQNLDGCGSLLLLGHIIASLRVDPTDLIRGGFLWSRDCVQVEWTPNIDPLIQYIIPQSYLRVKVYEVSCIHVSTAVLSNRGVASGNDEPRKV